MKMNEIKSLIIILCLFLSSFGATGETVDKELEMKKFGLGLHMLQFKASEINNFFVPANKILLTFNKENRFRRELEFGFTYHKESEHRSTTGIHLGIGIFGMSQVNKTNFYYGGRFSYGYVNKSVFGYNDSNTVYGIGPSLGVEYYLSSHFSIGGEINVRYMAYNEDIDVDLYNDFSILTTSGLILRFSF